MSANPGDRVVTCDDVKDCFEGDYSVWTEKWATPVTDVEPAGAGNNRGFVNVDGDRIFYRSERYGYIIKLSTGELLDTRDLNYYGYWNQSSAHSILGKYSVLVHWDLDKIEILKDGVVVQTITKTGEQLPGVAMSPDGKYIVFGSNADKVYCYEGS